MGLDFGLRRIGLAISDRTGTIASAYGKVHGGKYAVMDVCKVIQAEEVRRLVIGLPIHMNGEHGDKAVLVEEFGRSIQEHLPDLEILFEDERLTTVSAQRILLEGDLSRNKRKGVIDALAATIILQKHLDRMERESKKQLTNSLKKG